MSKKMTEDEKKKLGERGERESLSFLSKFGITTQRADLIGYPYSHWDTEICGELINSNEVIRVEVKTRSRLWNPPDYWAVGIEKKALEKYEKFNDQVKTRTLIVVPVLSDEKDFESIIGGYFVQWLHKLVKVPRERYFYETGDNGDIIINFHIDEFEAHYVDDELKNKINARK